MEQKCDVDKSGHANTEIKNVKNETNVTDFQMNIMICF